MADGSAIEWTDATWNPVTGCTKITAGCDNCYAARFSERWRGVPGHPFENGFDLTLRPERISQPLAWKRSRMIFVNSMSDLFHKAVPRVFIDSVFDTMEEADWHVFQVLTKRSSLMRDYLRRRYQDALPPAHIWCGVSVEDGRAKGRIEHLRAAPVGVRFLSVEPLIGAVGPVNLQGIDWVIVGGESGPGARPVHLDWASVQKLAATGLFEVVVNFTLSMALQRMLPNSGEVPDAWALALDVYFGDHAWFEAVYERGGGLFAASSIEKRADYSERLLALYRSRLRTAFGHVSAPRLIRNTRGAPLYYLIWAGPNKKGLEGADYILTMGERIGETKRGGQAL